MFVHLFIHVLAFCHVDHVTKEQLAIEGAEAEVEYQVEQPQEEEYVGEEQDQDQELTNFVDTQGKHRFILNPESLH